MSGITITPTLSDVVLTPGSPRIVEITVTNNDPVARILDASIADAVRLTSSSGVQLVAPADGPGRLSPIAQIVGLKQRAIDPGEKVIISVQINPPNPLPGDGMYGALVVSLKDLHGSESVAVQTSVSSLIFARSVDAAETELSLASSSDNGSIFRLPEQVALEVRNNGEVHTAPRGRVLLLTPNHDVLAQGFVNETSSIVMPHSERIFDTILAYSPDTHKPLLGKYQLVTEYRSNGALEPVLKTEDLLYIDPRLVVFSFVIALISAGMAMWLWKRNNPRSVLPFFR